VSAAPVAASIAYDTAAAVRFLQDFSGGGLVQLTAIPPDGKPETRSFQSSDTDCLYDFIEGHQGSSNLYFTVNPLRGSLNKKPKKKDIAELAWAHVDMDPREGFDREAERERIKRTLLGFSTSPHIIIDSGNGFQGIWRLRESMENDGDYARLEELNRRVADLLSGDNCHNIDRIMRLPFTVNLPSKTKRERGYTTVQATLIRFEKGTVSPTDFPQLPERFFSTLRKDQKLKRRWRADNSDLEDKTKSGLDKSIVGMLKFRGFTLAEIEQIFPYFLFGQGDKANVPRMYERSWAPTAAGSNQYEATSSGIMWNKQTKDGPTSVRLCNFVASIATEITEDDGVDQHHVFEIDAKLNGRSRRFQIPAKQFGALNWPMEHLGANAIIEAGYALKDHVRCAVQSLSEDVVQRVTYKHTGWANVDGQWVYLHAGGGVGAAGLISDVEVDPPSPLSHFRLPAPPDARALRDALRAELDLLNLAPDWISIPLFAAPFAVVLHPTDFGIHIAGPTSTFKSELAALVQQHFGTGFDSRHLPAAWSSTSNALEALAFFGKDAVLVIDDFAPSGPANDQRRLHQTAERLFRSQGSLSGRMRMRADTSLNTTKYPRGMILSTGEDIPRGQSLRARMLVLELSPGTIDKEKLTAAQSQRHSRPLALSGYVRWLAPQLAERRAAHATLVAEFRDQIRAAHLRTPDIVAHLYVGFGAFLDFCVDAGAIDERQADDLRARAETALADCARRQTDHITQADPALRCLELLASALGAGTAHVAALNGGPPADSERWGWRDFGTAGELRPLGPCVGWVHEDDLYLDANAAYRAAISMAGDDQPGVTIHMLKKLLHDKGLLKSVEHENRQTRYEVRVTAGGSRRRRLHLSADLIQPKGAATDVL